MSLDIGSDPVARALAPATPAPTQTAGGNALTSAVAALEPQQRAGLDQMTQTISGHLEAIRGGAPPPPDFTGSLAAHDQVLTGLGLPIPQTHADVRATLAMSQGNGQAATQPRPSSDAAQARTPPSAESQTVGSDPRRVAAALSTIREALAERPSANPAYWDVSHDDLIRIENAMVALTNRADASAVVRDLARTGDLQKWTTELDGQVGSYTDAERGRLFNVLARRLDAAQLTTFADALQDKPIQIRPGERGQEFGRAVAAGAPESIREAFVTSAASRATSDAEIGPAVGEALASLRGDALERTLRTLARTGRLDDVVNGSVSTASSYGEQRTYRSHSFDADTLGRVLGTVALSQNNAAKVSIIDAATRQMTHIGQERLVNMYGLDRSSTVIRDGITTVLRRDTAGVVDALNRLPPKPGMLPESGVFPDYLETMIRSGQVAEVGRMLARVGTGNGTESSARWITRQIPGDVDQRGYYANAQTLGFAVGSVSAALDAISSSRTAKADQIKIIFGTAAGVAGAANPASGVVAAVLTGTANAGINAVTASYIAGDQGLKESLTALSYPRNVDQSLYHGGASTHYGQRRDDVVNAQATRRR